MIKDISSVLLLLISFSFVVFGAFGANSYEIIAVSGSTPAIDGTVGSSEWSDAEYVQFNHTTVLVKQDGMNLYIGFKMAYPMVPEPNATILFDVDHDGGKMLQSDDLKIWIFRNGTLGEANVRDWQWSSTSVRGWNAEVRIYEFSWDAEFNITYSKIEVVAGVEKTIGTAFLATSFHYGEYGTDGWPANSSEIIMTPSNWGDLISTGYNWIPEFPSILILPLFMIATLLIVTTRRRRSKIH